MPTRRKPAAAVVSIRDLRWTRAERVYYGLHRKVWESALDTVFAGGVDTAVFGMMTFSMHAGEFTKVSQSWVAPTVKRIRILDKAGRRRCMTRLDLLLELSGALRSEKRKTDAEIAGLRGRPERGRKAGR